MAVCPGGAGGRGRRGAGATAPPVPAGCPRRPGTAGEQCQSGRPTAGRAQGREGSSWAAVGAFPRVALSLRLLHLWLPHPPSPPHVSLAARCHTWPRPGSLLTWLDCQQERGTGRVGSSMWTQGAGLTPPGVGSGQRAQARADCACSWPRQAPHTALLQSSFGLLDGAVPQGVSVKPKGPPLGYSLETPNLGCSGPRCVCRPVCCRCWPGSCRCMSVAAARGLRGHAS